MAFENTFPNQNDTIGTDVSKGFQKYVSKFDELVTVYVELLFLFT